MAINMSDRFLETNTVRQFGPKTLIRLAPAFELSGSRPRRFPYF